MGLKEIKRDVVGIKYWNNGINLVLRTCNSLSSDLKAVQKLQPEIRSFCFVFDG